MQPVTLTPKSHALSQGWEPFLFQIQFRYSQDCSRATKDYQYIKLACWSSCSFAAMAGPHQMTLWAIHGMWDGHFSHLCSKLILTPTNLNCKPVSFKHISHPQCLQHQSVRFYSFQNSSCINDDCNASV